MVNVHTRSPWQDMCALIAEILPDQTIAIWVPCSAIRKEATALHDLCHMARLYLRVDSENVDRTIDSLQYCNLWLDEATLYKAITLPYGDFPIVRDTKKIVFKTTFVHLNERAIHDLLEQANICIAAVCLQPFRNYGTVATRRG